MQRACHISSEDSKQLAASFTIIANVLDRLATRMEQLEQATVNLPPILPIAKPTPPKPVYWLFYSDVKHFIVKDDPNISYREANRRVKQLWKDSADELREKYKQKFKDLTAVYQEELAKYNESKSLAESSQPSSVCESNGTFSTLSMHSLSPVPLTMPAMPICGFSQRDFSSTPAWPTLTSATPPTTPSFPSVPASTLLSSNVISSFDHVLQISSSTEPAITPSLAAAVPVWDSVFDSVTTLWPTTPAVYSESADMATSQETVVVDTADRAIALLLSTISAPDKLSVEPCDAAEPLEPIDSAPSPMLKGKNAEKVDDSEVDAEPSVDLQREKKEKKRAAEETQGGVKTRKKKRVVEETQDGETKKRRSKYKAKESSTLSSIV